MTKVKQQRSDFLFPTPNFLTGAGNVFNLAGNYYSFNYSKSENEADCRALKSDWGVIGQDITDTIAQFHSEHEFPWVNG